VQLESKKKAITPYEQWDSRGLIHDIYDTVQRSTLSTDMVWLTLLSILSSKTLEFKYHPPAEQHPVSLQQNSKVRLQGLGHCYLSMAPQSSVGPWPLFQFFNPIHSQ
jgi:hypothetical protein